MNGSWNSLPDLLTPRRYLAAATDGQGHPLAIGGQDSSFDAVSTVERLKNGSWTEIESLNTARDLLAATTDSQDHPLIIGGQSNNGSALVTVERYEASQPPSASANLTVDILD
jgi:hypothetical protein